VNKIFVRLREEFGKYLAVGAAGVSLVIKRGGKCDPDGFALNEDLYEKFRKYLEPVSGEEPTRRRDLYFYGCGGFGDSFYQRALVRHLAKEHDTIYLRTAIPEVYWDIPNVKFLYPDSLNLRTQQKHIDRLDKSVWVERPKGIPYLHWSDCLLPFEKDAEGVFRRPGLREGEGNARCLERLNSIEDFNFSFPVKREWIGEAKKIIASLKTGGKKICIIRQPTIRKEWETSSRNPKIKYFQLLIDKYKEEYYFISVADVKKDEEWFVGRLRGVDKKFVRGELPVTTIFGLVRLADMVIAYPGFFVLLAVAVKTKCFCIFGGMQAPEHIFDENMGLENLEYVAPDPFCCCFDMKHACNKEIPEEKVIQKFEDLKDREKYVKKVSVGTPAGLGDMHWVLTKMESFKEKNCIDRLEIVIHQDCGHDNSSEFLELVPFIDDIGESPVPLNFSFSIIGGSGHPICKNKAGLDYHIEVNSRLEEGNELKNILPEYETNFDYHIEYPPDSKKFAEAVKRKVGGKIYLMYSSSIGGNRKWAQGTWESEDWVVLAERILDATGCRPVLIGKQWDVDYVDEILCLDRNKIIYNLVTKTNLKQALALVREASVFVSFPSGLAVLAAYFKTPVVMFWSIKGVSPEGVFEEGFQTSWLPPGARESGRYLPVIYGDASAKPENIFKSIKKFLCG